MGVSIAESATTESVGGALRRRIGIYLELAKARLGALVILTTLVGYILAARGLGDPFILLWTVIGTSLTAFGANILTSGGRPIATA